MGSLRATSPRPMPPRTSAASRRSTTSRGAPRSSATASGRAGRATTRSAHSARSSPMSAGVDLAAIPVSCVLSGEQMQSSSTMDLIFSIPYLVSYLSRQFTLQPGDVIATGTPAGVGVARSPQRFLRSGDVVEIAAVGGVGCCRTPSHDAARARPPAVAVSPSVRDGHIEHRVGEGRRRLLRRLWPMPPSIVRWA